LLFGVRAGGLHVAFQSYPCAHRLTSPMLADVAGFKAYVQAQVLALLEQSAVDEVPATGCGCSGTCRRRCVAV
jgi:hypothetical protein